MSYMLTGSPDRGFPDRFTTDFQYTGYAKLSDIPTSAEAMNYRRSSATFPRQQIRPSAAIRTFDDNRVDNLSTLDSDLDWTLPKRDSHYDWPRFVSSLNRMPPVSPALSSGSDTRGEIFGISTLAAISSDQGHYPTRGLQASPMKKSISVRGNRTSIHGLWSNRGLSASPSLGAKGVVADNLTDSPSRTRRVRFGDVQYLFFYAYESVESQNMMDVQQAPIYDAPLYEPPICETPRAPSSIVESLVKPIHPLTKFSWSSSAYSSPNLSTVDVSATLVSQPLDDSDDSDQEIYGVPSPATSPIRVHQPAEAQHWTLKARSTIELTASVSFPDISNRVPLVAIISPAPSSKISTAKSASRFSWSHKAQGNRLAGGSLSRVERRVSQLVKRTTELNLSGLWR